MTDRPILFSPEMVRAILAGRKTQTRRVLRGLPGDFGRTVWPCYLDGKRSETMCHPPRIGEGPNGARLSPVPVAPGDRLWVREAWRTTESLDHLSPKEIEAACLDAGYRGPWCPYRTEADQRLHYWDETTRWHGECKAFSDTPGRFRQGMHMPEWASRITLHVTDVRVERAQDISEADARAEGVEKTSRGLETGWVDYSGDTQLVGGARSSFCTLWDSLNAPRGYGWDVNPWVTATTFEPEFCNISEART